jgi:hypothetical protein
MLYSITKLLEGGWEGGVKTLHSELMIFNSNEMTVLLSGFYYFLLNSYIFSGVGELTIPYPIHTL